MSAADQADGDHEDVPAVEPARRTMEHPGEQIDGKPDDDPRTDDAAPGGRVPEVDPRSPLDQSTLHFSEQSKVKDHIDGVRLYVTGETKVEGRKVVHKLKSDTPSKIKPKPLHSNDFAVVDWENRKHDERRRITGYEHPVTRAAPKPISSGKRSSANLPPGAGEALPDGTCARCGGEGSYPWSEGEWRSCVSCLGTGYIGTSRDETEEFDDV